LADSLRASREAAAEVSVTYDAAPVLPRLSAGLSHAYSAPAILGDSADSLRGNLAVGRAAATTIIDSLYTTPTHNHCPLEPHAVVAYWQGDHITIHTSTSGIFAARRTIAHALQLPVDQVRVLMQYQGGGFGAKGSAWWPTLILAVSAARTLARPVRLELRREQMFTVTCRRSPTIQRLVLGADAAGQLTLIDHEATQETSPLAEYSDSTCFPSRSVYSCTNVATRHRLVRTNAPQPNPMRAPGEGPGSFALESALDELACALEVDPVALRLQNIAARDEHHNKDWSSNGLKACLLEGVQAFGWSWRKQNREQRREDDAAVGYGMASAYYPVFQGRANAQITLDGEGLVTLRCGNQDIGTGSATIMAQAVARELGMRASSVRIRYGDTELPEAPMAAGSMGTASVIPAVECAARALRVQIVDAACTDPRSPLYGQSTSHIHWISPFEITNGERTVRSSVIDLARQFEIPAWTATRNAGPDADNPYSGSAFGACFAEVRVVPEIGTIQVTRLTAAYAAGRILNETTARSQYIGGIIFGIGMALHERVDDDPQVGLPVNRHLGGYLIPTQADVPAIDIRLVEESDCNPASHGIKGVGMIGTVGVAAAIANAVYNATGLRIRRLPISPDVLVVGHTGKRKL
jgi:xanthine dehydrogenase YagR molybdenum-binding subunit